MTTVGYSPVALASELERDTEDQERKIMKQAVLSRAKSERPMGLNLKIPGLKLPASPFSATRHESLRPRTPSTPSSDFGSVYGNAAFEHEDEVPHQPMPSPRQQNNFFGAGGGRAEDEDGEQRRAAGSGSGSGASTSGAAAERESPSTPPAGRSSLTSSFANFFRPPPTPSRMATASTGVSNSGAAVERVDSMGRTGSGEMQSVQVTVASAWEKQLRRLLPISFEEALYRPAPSGAMIRCIVKRQKQLLGGGQTFEMLLEAGGLPLLAARKRKGKGKGSSFVIARRVEDTSCGEDDSLVLAKVESNLMGTQYQLWSKASGARSFDGASEDLCLGFTPNKVSSMGGPSTMSVLLPTPESDCRAGAPAAAAAAAASPRTGPRLRSLAGALEQARVKELPPGADRHLAMLCSRPPEWCEATKEFYLDFGGRASVTSSKNTQLVTWDAASGSKGCDTVLLLGKAGDSAFSLDFAYPMSIPTAFAVALATMDSKLCYLFG